MIEVKITPQMKKRAWTKARKMGKLRNSITGGKGNIAGFLGEEVANALIKGEISISGDCISYLCPSIVSRCGKTKWVHFV